MVNKLSFFMAMVQYNFLWFIPSKKQQSLECLEELSESVPVDICNQDILKVWMETFGIGGLLLGSIALFLAVLVIMATADIIIWRIGSTVAAAITMLLLVFFINIDAYATKGGYLC